MIALIAGTGDLPGVLAAALLSRGEPPVVYALAGFVPHLPDGVRSVPFRLETLGSLLADLRATGVTQVCFAGAVRRPVIDPAAVDAATLPLIADLRAAAAKGDDGALRIIIALFETAGFKVLAAADILPDLLPPVGMPTVRPASPLHEADAIAGLAAIDAMGRADLGQACIVQGGQVIGREDAAGTAALLARTTAAAGPVAVLVKAPKPGQDRRADLPLIGPQTARQVADAGLGGIIIAAGGVMVLDPAKVVGTLDRHGLFLWVRP